jgi:hypothetical protein
MSLLTANSDANLYNVPQYIRALNLTFNQIALDANIVPGVLFRFVNILKVEHLSLINSDIRFPPLKVDLHINIFNIVNNFSNLLSLKLNVDLKGVDLIFPNNLRYLHIIFKTNRRAKSFGLLDNLEVLTVEQGAWGQNFQDMIANNSLLEQVGNKLYSLTIRYQTMKMQVLRQIPTSIRHFSLLCHSRNRKELKTVDKCIIGSVQSFITKDQLISFEMNCVRNDALENISGILNKYQSNLRSLTLHGSGDLHLSEKAALTLASIKNLDCVRIKGGMIFKRGVKALCDANISLSLVCCEFNDPDVSELLQERGITHDPEPEQAVYRTETAREQLTVVKVVKQIA